MPLLRFFYSMFFTFISTKILLYFLGRLLFSIGLKKPGHYFVSTSVAGDFGLFKKIHLWIFINCPYDSCDTCKIWTCKYYSECPKKTSIKKNKQ